MAKKKTGCHWCHGAGVDADLHDMGLRRTIANDEPSGRVWAKTRRYRCDVCGKPEDLPEPMRPIITRGC